MRRSINNDDHINNYTKAHAGHFLDIKSINGEIVFRHWSEFFEGPYNITNHTIEGNSQQNLMEYEWDQKVGGFTVLPNKGDFVRPGEYILNYTLGNKNNHWGMKTICNCSGFRISQWI